MKNLAYSQMSQVYTFHTRWTVLPKLNEDPTRLLPSENEADVSVANNDAVREYGTKVKSNLKLTDRSSNQSTTLTK